MEQECEITGAKFIVDDAEREFLDQVSPIFGGKKYPIPLPTICPEERQRRRLAFRNLRHLYRRPCDFSQKPIVTMYHPDSPHKVFHTDHFWGDGWNAFDYGRDFDFQRPFFDQFTELFRDVPTLHQYVILSENCEYINGAASCRNCYLAFNMDYCEDCLYIADGVHCRSCVDCLAIRGCELCYECVNCDDCYELQYSDRCSKCTDSFFLSNCQRCRNCVGCCNMQDKEFYVFNQPVSKDAFVALKKSFSQRSEVEAFSKKFAKHRALYPRRFYHGHSNESFSGDELVHSKNSYDCYFSSELENCRYCNYMFQAANCYDYNIFGDHSQWIYQCLATGLNCSNDLFSIGCWSGASFNLYCIVVPASSNCFGCVGLHQKQYCIFNKQYQRDDYEALAGKIIDHMTGTGEWGKFFPPSMSPFSFDESVAAEEFPLPKDEAKRRGYNQFDRVRALPGGKNITVADNICDVGDDICAEVLTCTTTGAGYRFISQELSQYRKMGVPAPTLSPDARHRARLKRRTGRSLHRQRCAKCTAELQTTIDPKESTNVLCESCFRDSVE